MGFGQGFGADPAIFRSNYCRPFDHGLFGASSPCQGASIDMGMAVSGVEGWLRTNGCHFSSTTQKVFSGCVINIKGCKVQRCSAFFYLLGLPRSHSLGLFILPFFSLVRFPSFTHYITLVSNFSVVPFLESDTGCPVELVVCLFFFSALHIGRFAPEETNKITADRPCKALHIRQLQCGSSR